MPKRKAAKAKVLAYAVWSYPDHALFDDSTFDTLREVEEHVEQCLSADDYEAEDVVVCELVPRRVPETPVTEVQWKEIK